jgi:hypothetical protein
MPTQAERELVSRTANGSLQLLEREIALAGQRQLQLGATLNTAQTNLQNIRTSIIDVGASSDLEFQEKASAAIQHSGLALKSAAELIDRTPTVGAALDEWKECRATIDRCDKLLVDLRKTGFSFVIAIVSAAAFVFSKPDNFADTAKGSLLCMLVLLIIMLYIVDLAHQTWLGVAVGRALELEEGPLGFKLTTKISEGFAASKAVILGCALYTILLVATCAIFWFSIPLKTEDLTSAPRGTMYGAFAIGQFSIIAAPLISAKRWYWLLTLCGTAIVIGAFFYLKGIWRIP